jgi:hypothetical protein
VYDYLTSKVSDGQSRKDIWKNTRSPFYEPDGPQGMEHLLNRNSSSLKAVGRISRSDFQDALDIAFVAIEDSGRVCHLNFELHPQEEAASQTGRCISADKAPIDIIAKLSADVMDNKLDNDRPNEVATQQQGKEIALEPHYLILITLLIVVFPAYIIPASQFPNLVQLITVVVLCLSSLHWETVGVRTAQVTVKLCSNISRWMQFLKPLLDLEFLVF